MAGEIWHLSIEDLFQPVQEAPRLGGDGPYVINLSVSTAPISVPTKAFTSSRLDAHVYQIQVTEDGRTRYRLRLGPFTSEDEADAILAEVRDTYPGALTATAGAADLRVIASVQAKAEQRQSSQKQNVVIERSISQKIAAEKPALEKALPKTAAPENPPPEKAPVLESAVVARAEASEISIDIAWPTPELVLPVNKPQRVAPTALPELDVPLPIAPKRPAVPAAAVLSEPVAPAAKPVAPAPKPVELQLAPPYSIAGVAPVLTEVVIPAKTAAPKIAAPIPAVIAAPVLTQAMSKNEPAPKNEATPKKEAAPKTKAAAPLAPAVVATAPAPAAMPPQAIAPPAKPAVPKSAAPVESAKPAEPKIIAPIEPVKAAVPKSAAPPIAPVKPAPVLRQSLSAVRKFSSPKFRALLGKPTPSKLTSLQHVVVATAPAPAPREVKKLDEPLESLESTQTMRALTPSELEDNEVTRWFVIQLALADHAFDPDAVPNLDIFSEYRLYSVAGVDEGRVVHALRLGFFREEIGAVAVASYLAAYWDKPAIKRVSVAERERFADQRVEARKDVGATGKHAVIEITDELVARRRRSSRAPISPKPSNRPI
ncbi:MAG TPA: SPOR domain-containing protein [Steroidobacteraceae bacterium]|nr:SPOR domain-containing protein [Steroidobacteraceae bacterium]